MALAITGSIGVRDSSPGSDWCSFPPPFHTPDETRRGRGIEEGVGDRPATVPCGAAAPITWRPGPSPERERPAFTPRRRRSTTNASKPHSAAYQPIARPVPGVDDPDSYVTSSITKEIGGGYYTNFIDKTRVSRNLGKSGRRWVQGTPELPHTSTPRKIEIETGQSQSSYPAKPGAIEYNRGEEAELPLAYPLIIINTLRGGGNSDCTGIDSCHIWRLPRLRHAGCRVVPVALCRQPFRIGLEGRRSAAWQTG